MKRIETNEEFIYGLIIDDLEETITPQNKLILEKWRNDADKNEEIYQEFLSVQNNMDKLYDRNDYDADVSWNSLDKKLVDTTRQLPATKQKRGIKLWYKMAAAIIVILSVGSYFLLTNQYVVINTGNNAGITHVVLPDGTKVNLNTGTVIKYDKEKFATHRTLLLLKGEVFIHVTKHDASQFKVDLGDVQAEDIGTSFNVIKNDQKIMVIVEEGRVAMKQISSNKLVLLTPGKLGVYNARTKELSMSDNLNANYKAWIDKKLVFQEMPFEQVSVQLEKAYQVPVRIEGEALKNRKLTAKLQYQTLDSVLAVISASLQCKVTKDKDTYVLSDN